MSLAAALAIGAVFAAFQTVTGTLIALLLGAVLLTPARSDVYEAAALTAGGAVVTGILYQLVDPTFLTITTYLGMSPEQQLNNLFSHMIFPVIRFTLAQLIADIVIAKMVYRFTYQEKQDYLFTGLYTATKVAFALSIWALFIVPAFAQTL